jgi:putative Mg2+ transporter-C (MgtC) family protein
MSIASSVWPLVAIGSTISILMLTVLGLAERRWFPDEDYTE